MYCEKGHQYEKKFCQDADKGSKCEKCTGKIALGGLVSGENYYYCDKCEENVCRRCVNDNVFKFEFCLKDLADFEEPRKNRRKHRKLHYNDAQKLAVFIFCYRKYCQL
ncbi:hypothetical protein MHBO_000291 [Bonamia ostreae]|uniref:Uncharacterized protein n=1 Tax=Bonamia ostreae TaxID=126728 RepID=A0ABV2AF33_9EUKA